MSFPPWLLLVPLVLPARLAQVAEPPGLEVTESIVVVAERGPVARSEALGAVSALAAEEIERRPAATLAELVRTLPGIEMFFPAAVGGVPMASARGFFGAGEAEVLELRIDGVPLADVESGIADWRFLRGGRIDRVEVLRGSTSALYGGAALGGVVDVRTRSPRSPGAVLAFSGGSFGGAAADAAWRHQLVPGGIGVELAAGGERTDGFRDHSAADSTLFEIGAAGALGTGEWRGAVSGLERDREDPGPLSPAELSSDPRGSNALFRFDRERLARQRAWLGWDGAAGDTLWSSRLYARRRDSEFLRTLLVFAGLGDRVERELEAETAGLSVDGGRDHLSSRYGWQSRWGVEGARDRVDLQYFIVDDLGRVGAGLPRRSAERSRAAFFGSLSRPLGERVRILGSLRWDGLEDGSSAAPDETRHRATSPRLGLVARLGGSDRPFLGFISLSRSFKAPTLDQLYDPRPFPDFAGGTFTISNPDLAPQRAKGVDLGVSRMAARSRWEVTGYHLDVTDEIDFDPATFRYLNLGASRHRGVEASWRQTAGALRPSLQWTWTEAVPRQGENRGRQLKNLPEHRVAATLEARLPGEWEAVAGVTWLSGRFLDDGHRFPLPSVAVADLGLARAFSRTRVQLEVSNLFNRSWTAVGYVLPDLAGTPVPLHFPAPGRGARLAVSWRSP